MVSLESNKYDFLLEIAYLSEIKKAAINAA